MQTPKQKVHVVNQDGGQQPDSGSAGIIPRGLPLFWGSKTKENDETLEAHIRKEVETELAACMKVSKPVTSSEFQALVEKEVRRRLHHIV